MNNENEFILLTKVKFYDKLIEKIKELKNDVAEQKYLAEMVGEYVLDEIQEYEENEKMLKSLEGKKTFKHCLGCGRMFFKGTVCPWCKGGWVYGFIDEHNRVTFEDENENGETKAKDGFIEMTENQVRMWRKNDKRKNN